jgi:hypothetical protein
MANKRQKYIPEEVGPAIAVWRVKKGAARIFSPPRLSAV